jgi:hypothetical protein
MRAEKPLPSIEEDAIAIMRMLVNGKGLKAGDTMANVKIVDAVSELGMDDIRVADALTYAGDQAWLESRDGGFTLLSEAGYMAGLSKSA